MRFVLALAVASIIAFPVKDAAAQSANETHGWLPSLETETPEEGFALAITLARKAVTTAQPDRAVLFELREQYSVDEASLIAVSQTVAAYFAIIATANDHWRSQ